MVTALALYTGRSFNEFELVGLSTNPELIAAVVAVLAEENPSVLSHGPTGKHRRALLRLVPKDHGGT
jgi:hypothetical protein